MNIHSKSGYPAASLSNFAPHPFVLTWKGFTVECNSMEGFLQSLKFKNPLMQIEVCKLVGIKAKTRGRNKRWQVKQILWWAGQPIGRHTYEYQELLDAAYEALLKNTKFRKALVSTGDATLTHSIGKSNEKDTVLTRSEFCKRLLKMRGTLNE